MLDQNLLDKQFILESLIDLLEKSLHSNQKIHLASNLLVDNSAVKLLLSTSKFSIFILNFLKTLVHFYFFFKVAQNMHHFLQSELLSRRLAYFCCKRLSIMFNEYSQKFFDPTLKQLQNLSNNSTTTTTITTTTNTNNSNKLAQTTTTPSSDFNLVEANNFVLKKNVSIEAV